MCIRDSASEQRELLLAELGQRRKIEAISNSYKSCCSALRCYAAFCDAVGQVPHFPTSEGLMVQYTAMFKNADTLEQYIKHVAWAHRFLEMDDKAWRTASLKQIIRGLKKGSTVYAHRPSLQGPQVRRMVKGALRNGEVEVAAMLAIARHFMLRVPSEAIPLEWDGTHSKIQVGDKSCTLTLTKRKNRQYPTALVRECCCQDSGKLFCSVHWLQFLQHRGGQSGRVFGLTARGFASRLKVWAESTGVENAQRCGTHSLRRGMAQDILDLGGSLPALLHAGDWTSSAYLKYLRVSQTDDTAVARAVMHFSDSEDE